MPGLSHPKAQGLVCLCQLQREEDFCFSYQREKSTNQPTRSRWPSLRALPRVTQPTSGRVPHCHNFTQSCSLLEPATCHWRVMGGGGEETGLLKAKCEPWSEHSLPPGPPRPRFDSVILVLSVSALHSQGTLISAVCFCTGKAEYFYYLFYYVSYELLLFA